jgi:hypothetical protein
MFEMAFWSITIHLAVRESIARITVKEKAIVTYVHRSVFVQELNSEVELMMAIQDFKC